MSHHHSTCETSITREQARQYLINTTPTSMMDLLPKVISSNLPILMARSCQNFVCETGHAYWRVCPQCGANYGDGTPSCIITHG